MKIKRPDLEIKEGKLTRYVEQPDLDTKDLGCPCCGRPLEYGERTEINGHGSSLHSWHFSCVECCLDFRGIDDNHHFLDVADFYRYVKGCLALKGNQGK